MKKIFMVFAAAVAIFVSMVTCRAITIDGNVYKVINNSTNYLQTCGDRDVPGTFFAYKEPNLNFEVPGGVVISPGATVYVTCDNYFTPAHFSMPGLQYYYTPPATNEVVSNLDGMTAYTVTDGVCYNELGRPLPFSISWEMMPADDRTPTPIDEFTGDYILPPE